MIGFVELLCLAHAFDGRYSSLLILILFLLAGTIHKQTGFQYLTNALSVQQQTTPRTKETWLPTLYETQIL